MGTQAPWRQEKEHFMNPQTVIYSLLSLTPVCTHEFPCYLMCLCDIKGTVSENRAVFIMYFIQKLLSFKQVHEKQSCLSWCMFSWLSLYLKHSPCYHSEIKELLIAYVFKYGLKMIMKQDYLKWNAAKDLQFKLGGEKNVAGSIPKLMTWIKDMWNLFKKSSNSVNVWGYLKRWSGK